jgi:hypothetical protein
VTGFVACAAFAAAALTACSSSYDPKGPEPSNTLGSDGGEPSTSSGSSSGGNPGAGASTSSSSSSGNALVADDGGGSPNDCIAACEAKHPAAAKKNKEIDACFMASCAAACEKPDPDGQIHGPTGTDCKSPVGTPSAACSTCVAKNCCAVWDGCFGDAECQALNACATACPAK